MNPEPEGIAAAALPLSASAPGKCIVFGEHAVVHGGPELLFALDLRTHLVLRASAATTVNGRTETAEANPYLKEALRRFAPPVPGLGLTAISRLPRGSGLGSSAAFVAALAAGLSALRGGVDRASLAQRAFEIERGAQGVGSPGDTSAAVAGGFLALNTVHGTPLWEVTAGAETWTVRRVPDPGWNWVVAYSKVPHDTGRAVRSVSERLHRPDGPALLGRFRDVAEAGIAALIAEDRAAVGRSLAENERLLEEVGVANDRLRTLLGVAAEESAGAKITGAGMGGSIVALPEPGAESRVRQRLERAGAEAFVVRPSADGARLL